MKISYYEAFDLIAEDAVDLLVENSGDTTFLNRFSAEATLEAVLGTAAQNKVVKKRIPIKMRFLIAAVIVLAVSAVSLADKDLGAKLITDENRYLVGKSVGISVSVYDKFGKLLQGSGAINPESKDIIEQSTIIEKIEDDTIIPNTVKEFATIHSEEKFITPEVISSNGDMVIFMTSNGTGWVLEKGEKLVLEIELYPSGKNQAVVYQIIVNGVLQEELESKYGDNQEFEMIAEHDGEYCIGMINVNSNYLALKKGEIRVEEK